MSNSFIQALLMDDRPVVAPEGPVCTPNIHYSDGTSTTIDLYHKVGYTCFGGNSSGSLGGPIHAATYSYLIKGVVFGAGLPGSYSYIGRCSTNGLIWENEWTGHSTTSGYFQTIAASNTDILAGGHAIRYVCRAYYGSGFLLQQWVQLASPIAGVVRPIIWCGSQFVAFDDGYLRSTVSTTGVSWSTSSMTGTATALYRGKGAYGNGTCVVTTRSPSAAGIIYSTNLTTWNNASTPSLSAGDYWGSVVYGNGKFVAISQGSNTNGANLTVATSTDGITWVSSATLNAGSTTTPRGVITFGDGIFCIVTCSGANYNQYVYLSRDGINWYLSPESATDSRPIEVVYDGCSFITIPEYMGVGYARDINKYRAHIYTPKRTILVLHAESVADSSGQYPKIVSIPSTLVETFADPNQYSLTTTGYAPSLVTTGHVTAKPGTNALAITRYTPTIYAPIRPGVGSISNTGYIPLAQGPVESLPSAYSMVVAGQTPIRIRTVSLPDVTTSKVLDNFTGTDGTLLSSHTLDSGGVWTKAAWSGGETLRIYSNRTRGTALGDDGWYYKSVPAYTPGLDVRLVMDITAPSVLSYPPYEGTYAYAELYQTITAGDPDGYIGMVWAYHSQDTPNQVMLYAEVGNAGTASYYVGVTSGSTVSVELVISGTQAWLIADSVIKETWETEGNIATIGYLSVYNSTSYSAFNRTMTINKVQLLID